MNIEDIMPSEINPSQKDQYSMIPLKERSRMVKIIETKVEWWFPGSEKRESEKLLFIGFRALVFQDKKISREMDDGDVCTTV